MAVCGVLASFPALHLSACVCVWGRVRTRAPVFNAVRHRVICWGGSPVASGCLSCCATSLRTGEAGGWTSHPRAREPLYDACAPSALTNARRQQEEGLLRLRRPNPPEATAPSPSPPSPPLLKEPSGSLQFGSPAGGVFAFVPCSRDHCKQEKKSASIPPSH